MGSKHVGIWSSFDPPAAYGSIWVGLTLGNEASQADWLVAYRIAPQGDHAVVAEIRILPRPKTEDELRWVTASLTDHEPRHRRWALPAIPEGGLSARAARAGIRTLEALDEARRELGFQFAQPSRSGPTGHAFTPETLAAPRRPGRKGRGDRFYAELAAVYVEAVAAGSPHPVKDVTTRLARERREYYSETSVRALIHQARRRGLLTKPPRGRAGGQLTEKAHALLSDGSTEENR